MKNVSMQVIMDRRSVIALLCTTSCTPYAGAASSWRLATGYRADSFHGLNLQQFVRETEDATHSKVRIDFHAQNSLVKLADMLGAVETGKVEIGEAIMSGLVKELPLAGADSVPFIVRSYADARRLWRHQRPLIDRAFAPRGLRVLYAVPWPPQCLYSTKPMVSIADLRGTRMRTYNGTTVRIAELVHAAPVDVPMVEVDKALAEGRIDNMITSAVTGVENAVWTHLKYFYEINAWFPKNLVFVNARAFDALGPSERVALLQAADAAETRGWAASEAAASDAVDRLRRNGMKVERASAELVTQLKSLGERFSLEWIRKVGIEANAMFIPYFTQS